MSLSKTSYCTHGQHQVPKKYIAATRRNEKTGRTISTCFSCLNESVKGPTVEKRIFSAAELNNRENSSPYGGRS